MNSSRSASQSVQPASVDNVTLLAYGLTVLFAGANAVAVRFTVAEMPPFWGAVLRFSAAALIFWVIAIIRRAPMPPRSTVMGISIYGLLAFGVSYAFLYWGLQAVPAGLTQVILALVPLMTFFAAVFHRLEAFRWRGLLGAILAVAGIAFAFFEQPGEAPPVPSLLAIVAGAACIAESTVVIKLYPRSDLFMTNALALSVGSITLVVLSLLAGEPWILPARPETWVSIIYLILIGSVVVFYLYLFVVSRWTASATSYQFVLFPFVTVLLAAWLADEPIAPALLIGGVLVIVGVWVGALSGTPTGPRK